MVRNQLGVKRSVRAGGLASRAPSRAPTSTRRPRRRVPILGATWLAYMKLASPRGKDRDDIVGMMQARTVDRAALEAAVAGDPELESRLAEALRELELADE